MKRAYADVPEGQIHYRTEGNGMPVILLHMAGSSSNEYSRMLPFLAKEYRAIAMDFPGYGESDKPPSQYRILDYARTVVNFMDALGITKASIVGHHAGAVVGAEIAATWPDRIEKLVLSSLTYHKDLNQQKADGNRPEFTRVEVDHGGKHLVEWWRRAARYGDSAEIVDERVLDFHKAGPRGEELHWALFEHDTNISLPLIKCPTLVLSGTRDQFSAAVPEVSKLIPNSKINVIENGPVYIDRIMPKEFAEAIIAFLKSPTV